MDHYKIRRKNAAAKRKIVGMIIEKWGVWKKTGIVQ